MNQRELSKEGVDLKLTFLLLLRKIAYIVIAALAGALICGGIYALWHGNVMKHRKYTAASKYYITFEKIEDESFFDFYYNGATWDELLSTDAILGYAMTLLPDTYDRSYVDSCIEAWLYADVRVLTTVVTAKDLQETELFQDAIEQAVVHFAADGEKLDAIEIIQSDEPSPEEIADNVLRAALTGAVGFAVMMLLLLLLVLAIQDAIYLPEQFTRRYPEIPIAGIRFPEPAGSTYQKELEANLSYLTGGCAYPEISMTELLPGDQKVYDKIQKAGGVILEFPQGKENSKKLNHVLQNLALRNCRVICTVMTGRLYKLTKCYYRI